jgi:transcription initiation factor TFIIIB Brf1 subunit/transcription initiation factor TFIIB
VEDEDAIGDSMLCDNCHKPSLRHNVAEGTVVCIECALVYKSSLIDQTKEFRDFGPGENGANSVQRERNGEKMSIDKINSIRTEFSSGQIGKRQRFNAINPSQRTQVDPKEWYADYFRKM